MADARSAPRGERADLLRRWKALPDTRAEVVAIKDSFQRRYRQALVTELREDEATETAVRAQSPRHCYMHLATPGFFAPAELRSALAASKADQARPGDLFAEKDVTGWHPGLLSGLVLVGANRTAPPGQGLLGVQRAFQVAGAKSVVASLWKVDGAATRQLLTRFYENLWRAKKPLGNLEALREAQLWMLREGRMRGITERAVDPQKVDQAKPEGQRLPPFFWASFVLSGDWR